MYKIKLIVGLPGSGKTYYMNQLDGHKIDDPKIGQEFPILDQDILITDPNFCDEKTLNKAIKKLNSIYPDTEIELIYFENKPEKCLRNVEYRDDGKEVSQFIKHYSSIYNPPKNVLEIWQP